MTFQIHDLSDLSDEMAYAETQCNESIRDGDILVLADGARAILCGAWPVLFDGDAEGFHQLSEGHTLERLGKTYADNVTAYRATQPDTIAAVSYSKAGGLTLTSQRGQRIVVDAADMHVWSKLYGGSKRPPTVGAPWSRVVDASMKWTQLLIAGLI